MTRASVQGQGLGQSDTAQITATSNLLNYAAPPLCFGFWFNPLTLSGTRSYTQLRNSGSSANLTFTGSNTYQGSDGTTPFSITAGTENSNAWHFVLIRERSASDRWLSVFEQSTGKITHTHDTTALTWIDTPDTWNIVVQSTTASSLSRIDMAEFWYTDADVQVASGQVGDSLFWQLANYGPFSVPYLFPNIVEYRQLKFDAPGPDIAYHRSNKTSPNWAVNNILNDAGSVSIGMGPGPPLSGGYVRLNQIPRILEV